MESLKLMAKVKGRKVTPRMPRRTMRAAYLIETTGDRWAVVDQIDGTLVFAGTLDECRDWLDSWENVTR